MFNSKSQKPEHTDYEEHPNYDHGYDNSGTYTNGRKKPLSKEKVVLFVLSLLVLALFLTGVGALAGLGIFGSALAGFVLSKMALSVFSAIAAKLTISTLTLAALATGFAVYINTFINLKWRDPAILSNVFFGCRILVNNKEPFTDILRDLLKIAFFPVYVVPNFLYSLGILACSLFINVNIGKRTSAISFINLVLNPLKFLQFTLDTIDRLLLRCLEIFSAKNETSSIPRLFCKGFVNGFFMLLILPLSELARITDIPFYLLKTVFYTIPTAIYGVIKGQGHRQEEKGYQTYYPMEDMGDNRKNPSNYSSSTRNPDPYGRANYNSPVTGTSPSGRLNSSNPSQVPSAYGQGGSGLTYGHGR